jgi:tetraacyldisaccharide 4'-kinase
VTSVRERIARALATEKSGVTRVALAPAAALYGLVSRLRATAYARGLLHGRRLSTPVLSVGNLTLGGTGKTPLVVALARALGEDGLRVAILTRGYRRTSRDRDVLLSEAGELPPQAVARGGDEPALMARELPGVPIVVASDRAAAGAWAERELAPDVFVLDDGFQHLRLARDLDVLVVDATDPFGGGAAPPLGRLREPAAAAARAGVVVVTRSGRSGDLQALDSSLRALVAPSTPILHVDHTIASYRPLGGGPHIAARDFAGRRVGVLTAIGNPAVFLDDLGRAGLSIVSESLCADHHDFARSDFASASDASRAAGADALVTTEKDAVKLERLDPPPLPVYVARIRPTGELEALFDAARRVARRERK